MVQKIVLNRMSHKYLLYSLFKIKPKLSFSEEIKSITIAQKTTSSRKTNTTSQTVSEFLRTNDKLYNRCEADPFNAKFSHDLCRPADLLLLYTLLCFFKFVSRANNSKSCPLNN